MFRKSSANAAVGGFKPLPAGRLRRAYLHLSRSTASRGSTYSKLPSAFVTHETEIQQSLTLALAAGSGYDASTQPARASHRWTQQCLHISIDGRASTGVALKIYGGIPFTHCADLVRLAPGESESVSLDELYTLLRLLREHHTTITEVAA